MHSVLGCQLKVLDPSVKREAGGQRTRTSLLVRLRLRLVTVLLDLVTNRVESRGSPLAERGVGVTLGDLLCAAKRISLRSPAKLSSTHCFPPSTRPMYTP